MISMLEKALLRPPFRDKDWILWQAGLFITLFVFKGIIRFLKGLRDPEKMFGCLLGSMLFFEGKSSRISVMIS